MAANAFAEDIRLPMKSFRGYSRSHKGLPSRSASDAIQPFGRISG